MLQEVITTVGRICCDSSSHLNVASVLVEGCMEGNKSSVVQLDLSQVKGFSLFPGQVKFLVKVLLNSILTALPRFLTLYFVNVN